MSEHPWIPYQPKREREKEFYDIMLRNGAIVECCWPNGVHFTQIDGEFTRKAGKGPYADYRVTHIRRCVHPMNRPLFKRGDRVQVCPAPKCGHSGGITGSVDIIGRFADTSEPNIEMATVLRDGGGMCGPFRLNELKFLDV